MTLTGKQCEQYLITNGMGKRAQVGYDLTVKSIKKYLSGGCVGLKKTTPAWFQKKLKSD